MARLALKVKATKKQKYKTRQYKMCRICFRDLANKGLIPGVTKSSW